MRARPRVAVAAVLAGVCAIGPGCTDDEPGADGPTTVAAPTAPAPTAPAPTAASPTASTPSGAGGPASDTGDAVTGTAAGVTESLPAVPEVGVPGLDSDEVVCRAWSRFGGSFQAVSVAAAFGSGDPVAVAALEVSAAPTVTAAYHELVVNWPDELAAEADVAAESYFGPFARRADQALAALEAAGADAPIIATITVAWQDALASRDPAEPEMMVSLPPDAQAVVDVAAAEVAAQLVPIPSDTSLVTDAEVPLTEQYLVDNCPDRGTLGGVDE